VEKNETDGLADLQDADGDARGDGTERKENHHHLDCEGKLKVGGISIDQINQGST